LLNRRQARWSEELKQYNFKLLYHKGSSNARAAILSRCPVFTSEQGGTTSATNQTIFDKEKWLEVGAMEIDRDDDYELIQISATKVDQLLPEAQEEMNEKTMLDELYWELCKQIMIGGNIAKRFSISNELLCWNNRIDVPNGLGQQVIQSEHDSKVPGYCARSILSTWWPGTFTGQIGNTV